MATRRPLVVVNGVTSELPSGDTTPTNSVAPGTARQLLQTNAGGTATEWTSNVDVPGTLDVTSTATFDSIAQYPAGSAGAPTITFTGDTNTGIYSPGADQVAISTGGSGRLFINSSGQVGIGGSPAYMLDVTTGPFNDVARFTGFNAGTLLFRNASTDLCEIRAESGDALALGAGGSERLRITSAGLVGVGTSSPAQILHCTTTNGTASQLQFTQQFQREYRIGVPASSTSFEVYDVSAGASRLTIDSSGRLGVGTTSPSSTLHVSGSGTVVQQIQSTGGATELKLIANTQTNASYNNIYSGDGTNWNWRIGGGDGTTNTLTLATGGSERLRIDSSGRVGIGTSSPSERLHVNGGNLLIQDFTPEILLRSPDGTSNRYFISANISDTGDGGIVIGEGANLDTGIQRLVINGSGNVGVGIASPGYPLTVKTTTDGGQAILDLDNQDVGNYGGLRVHLGKTDRECRLEATYGSSFFSFYTDNAERMRITSGGNVGIGTTSPGTLLGLSDSSSISWGATNFPYINGNNSSNFIAFGTQATERARIDSSGRLLVGTSSARSNFRNGSQSAQVQLEGTSADTSRLAIINNSNTDTGFLYFARSKGTTIGSNTVVTSGDYLGSIIFAGNDGSEFVDGATIDAIVDGTPGANDLPTRLVFSTTADGASSPTGRMAIRNNGQILSYNDNVAGSISLNLRSGVGASSASFFLIGSHSATGVLSGSVTDSIYIFTNGNVQNTNNSYGAISDAKLKENIVDATSQWSDIKALQVRKYNLKEGQTHTQIGLVAQEVELVSPGLVSESPDRDAEGNDLGTVTKSVNYSVLYMKAVKALQEAMERIETLEVKVAALESA